MCSAKNWIRGVGGGSQEVGVFVLFKQAWFSPSFVNQFLNLNSEKIDNFTGGNYIDCFTQTDRHDPEKTQN